MTLELLILMNSVHLPYLQNQYELETQKLFLQPDQQSNAALATVAVNYGIQDNANVLLDLKANKDQDIVLLNERILKIEAESEAMKKKIEAES